MKTVKSLICALFVTAAMAVSAVAQDKEDAFNKWNLSIAGGGSTSIGNTTSTFGAQVGLSKEGQFILPLEAGVRQGFLYASQGDKVGFNTQPFADFRLIKLGNISLFAGANASATYGNTPLAWTAGPEAVLKFDLTKDAYFFGRAGYDFALNNRASFGDKGRDNVSYNIGIGIRF